LRIISGEVNYEKVKYIPEYPNKLVFHYILRSTTSWCRSNT